MLNFVAAFLLILHCSAIVAADSHSERIRFIYFNDFHSQNLPLKQDEVASSSPLVGGAATLAAYIDLFKQNFDSHVFVIDAGDDYQGSPICEITKGFSQVKILNVIMPDIMTIGNHEFDYGRDGINILIENAKFPIVTTNILDKIRETYVGEKHLIRKFGNIRIGFIGLISNSMPKLTQEENLEGYTFLNTHLAARATIEEIRDQVDLIVVVSHCGDVADISLARKVEDIDIIIGGHSHKTLFKPLIKNNTIICQAGYKGKYVGILDILVDVESKKITKYQTWLEDTFVDNVQPNPLVKHIVDSLENSIGDKFTTVIGHLETPWVRGRREESNIGNWIADAIREYEGTDVSIQNRNGIRKDQAGGDIAVKDIWEIMPFANKLVSFELTGSEIKAMLEKNVAAGTDFMLFSGLRYEWNTRAKPGERIQNISISGRPLQVNTSYTICTNDYLVNPNKFSDAFGLSRAGRTFEYSEQTIREILVEKVKAEKTIQSTTDGRIKIIR